MRAVVQRVSRAEVRVDRLPAQPRARDDSLLAQPSARDVSLVAHPSARVDEEVVGQIERGLLVYLGIGLRDEEAEVEWMANKVEGLRIFEDEQQKMSRAVREVAGSVLVVSQFTLYGDVRKGRRPSFDMAKPPDAANLLYERFCEALRVRGLTVAQGRFRATMRVLAEVDGPVTILVDSDRAF